MITGIDIVQTQIKVAEGYALDSDEIGIKSQDDVRCLATPSSAVSRRKTR